MPTAQRGNISQKATDFLKSRKNANNLIDILEMLETQDESLTQICIADLVHIFETVFKRKELAMKKEIKSAKNSAAETAYRKWLRALYNSTFTKLIDVFMCMANVQKQALAALMNLIALEEGNPMKKRIQVKSEGSFPVYRLKEIVATLLSSSKRTSSQIKAFIFGVKNYDDVKFFTWELILGSDYTKESTQDEIFFKNYLCLFDNMLINYNNGDETRLCNESTTFTMDKTIIPSKIEQTWVLMMKWKLTPELHKQMMEILLIKVIPHMKYPLWYTDYLVATLNAGGALSILALQAMLTLIQKFNMDYPLAYEKLYMMMNPEVFHQKYKQRLFYMADMFLSSSHLPQSMVASFVKRMARLTLVAPAHDIQILLAFIGNLLIRHAGLKKMLVGSHQDPDHECDPFDMNENDPNKTRAIESFLWEIHSLKEHYLPAISNSVKELIEKPLPAVEWELGPLLDATQDKIFERELRKTAPEIVVNYDKPKSMQLPQGEVLLQYWTLT